MSALFWDPSKIKHIFSVFGFVVSVVAFYFVHNERSKHNVTLLISSFSFDNKSFRLKLSSDFNFGAFELICFSEIKKFIYLNNKMAYFMLFDYYSLV